MTILLEPRRLEFSRYFDLYDGNLDSLFRVEGTAVNGIGLLGMGNIQTRFNYLQALSRFYEAAITSDLPNGDPVVNSLVHKAAEHWSVTGEVVLVRNGNGTVRAVRPDYVFPIVDPYDAEKINQYLFVFPQRRTQEGNWGNIVHTDRARVIVFDVETRSSTVGTVRYTQGVIEGNLPTTQTAGIAQVVWIKNGAPPYVAVEGLVREICVRLNMLQLALNTTSLPLIQIDKDSLNDGALRGSAADLETVQKLATSPLGLNTTLPFAGEEGARYIERAGTGLGESMEYVRMLLGQLGVVSGVPDYVFGVQLGRPNNETERVLFAGQTRVNSFRRDLEEGFKTLGLELHFANEPFVTRKERQALILEQLAGGVITVAEARGALGYDGDIPGGGNGVQSPD